MSDEAALPSIERVVMACAIRVVRSESYGPTGGTSLVSRDALGDLRYALECLTADEASAMASKHAADPARVVADLEATIPHPIPHESPKEG